MLTGLYKYRGFIWQRAVADLRHRYAGTNLGVVWNVLNPLAIITVYAVVFTQIMKQDLGSLPAAGLDPRLYFVLHLCSGFFPWLAFAECVTRGSGAFSENAPYLKRLPVPEQVFVAQTAASATLGLAISFSLLLAVSLVLGLRPTWHWLLLPVPLAAMQTLGFGVGLVCGTLNVFFRDIGQFVGVALQIVLWTAPVVYLERSLSAGLRRAMDWHPLVPPLRAVRDLFLHHALPSAATWAGLAAWPVLVVALAYAVFRPLRAEIRDNV